MTYKVTERGRRGSNIYDFVYFNSGLKNYAITCSVLKYEYIIDNAGGFGTETDDYCCTNLCFY